MKFDMGAQVLSSLTSKSRGSSDDLGTLMAYDTGASADAQGNIQVVIARLEEVIAARDGQVKAAVCAETFCSAVRGG
nr:hypothetical protein [Streptomyces sp. NRRL B-24720]